MIEFDQLSLVTFGMIFGLSSIGIFHGYLALSKAIEKGLPDEIRQRSRRWRSVHEKAGIRLQRH